MFPEYIPLEQSASRPNIQVDPRLSVVAALFYRSIYDPCDRTRFTAAFSDALFPSSALDLANRFARNTRFSILLSRCSDTRRICSHALPVALPRVLRRYDLSSPPGVHRYVPVRGGSPWFQANSIATAKLELAGIGRARRFARLAEDLVDRCEDGAARRIKRIAGARREDEWSRNSITYTFARLAGRVARRVAAVSRSTP